MKRAVFSGFVSAGGALTFKNPRVVKQFLASMADCEIDVTMEKHHRKRSDRQNRYYWGVVIPAIQIEIGEENPELVHGWLQVEVGNFDTICGTRVPRGTSQLSTAEFEEYASRVRMFASKFYGVYIPDPNEGVVEFGR